MKGLPTERMHTKDEMYDFMRGPFENATTFADVEGNRQTWDDFPPGSGKHVPMMIAVEYGEWRVYHSPMGHFDYSQERSRLYHYPTTRSRMGSHRSSNSNHP